MSSFMSQVEQKTVFSESKDVPGPEPRLQGEAVAQGGVGAAGKSAICCVQQTLGSSEAKST